MHLLQPHMPAHSCFGPRRIIRRGRVTHHQALFNLGLGFGTGWGVVLGCFGSRSMILIPADFSPLENPPRLKVMICKILGANLDSL